MSTWVDAADVASLSDRESCMIPYVVLFFPASAQSHLYDAQDTPNGCVVSWGLVLSRARFPRNELRCCSSIRALSC